jgi:prophage antirepressor-like protein
MNSITKFRCEDVAGAEVSCVVAQSEPWFKAREIAQALGYSNAKQAVLLNVDEKDKKPLKQLDVPSQRLKINPTGGALANAAYVNESGLCSLILRSNKPEAKIFKR